MASDDDGKPDEGWAKGEHKYLSNHFARNYTKHSTYIQIDETKPISDITNTITIK